MPFPVRVGPSDCRHCGLSKMKHQVLLRGGLADGRCVEIEDGEIEFRHSYALAGDPLALDKMGLPPGVERIGGVVVEALYFDSGNITGGRVAMRIFEFLELDP